MNCGFGNAGVNGTIGEELDIDVKVELGYDSFLNTLKTNFPGSGIEPVLFFETSRGCWWGGASPLHVLWFKRHDHAIPGHGSRKGYRAIGVALRQIRNLVFPL